jgi:hypothetical protein
MPITFAELLVDKTFAIKNRRDIKAFYEAVKQAVKSKKLRLEGHSLPVSLNDWIRRIEGDKKSLGRDLDVVDFSLADDKKFQGWKRAFLEELAKTREAHKTISLSQSAYDLLLGLKALQEANHSSMQLMNGNKDDVVAGLSDLQGAAYMLLSSYDKVRESLKLPLREVALERVKIKAPKPAKAPVSEAPQEKKVRKAKSKPKGLEASAI